MIRAVYFTLIIVFLCLAAYFAYAMSSLYYRHGGDAAGQGVLAASIYINGTLVALLLYVLSFIGSRQLGRIRFIGYSLFPILLLVPTMLLGYAVWTKKTAIHHNVVYQLRLIDGSSIDSGTRANFSNGPTGIQGGSLITSATTILHDGSVIENVLEIEDARNALVEIHEAEGRDQHFRIAVPQNVGDTEWSVWARPGYTEPPSGGHTKTPLLEYELRYRFVKIPNDSP